jgi:hypothetical protein
MKKVQYEIFEDLKCPASLGNGFQHLFYLLAEIQDLITVEDKQIRIRVKSILKIVFE